MTSSPELTDPLLRPQSSSPSDTSFGSRNSTVVASPASPAYQRPAYQRVNSLAEQIDSSFRSPLRQADINTAYEGHGLGISDLDEQKRSSVPRVPVGSKSDPNSPGSPLSPATAKLAGKLYRALGSHPEEDERDTPHIPCNPSTPSLHQTFGANSELEDLNSKPRPTTRREFPCRTRRPFQTGRGSWLAVTILILAIYSTVFSGIWLMIAIKKPRYGHAITTAGKLSPNTASLLCAAFAKSIELSFVTVFVAFLGQLLSTRALSRNGKGVTIAEMSMRSWVMQPGTLLTHFESVKYAAATFLGVFALLAALMAMVYTTASDALVAPKLKFGKTEELVMYGKVATSFANTYYVEAHCNTPIQSKTDNIDYQTTCISIQHAGEAYHNYMQYLTNWVGNIDSGNGSTNLAQRPDPVGMLYDNMTVKGSWINLVKDQNMAVLSQNYSKIVNNITMAMPHPGILAAARDPINGILQPQDLSVSLPVLGYTLSRRSKSNLSDWEQGLGEYYLRASVPSPTINVLCANVSEADLEPMVYELWPPTDNNGTIPNSTTWPNGFNLAMPSNLTKTPVDDLFGFDDINVHPIFPKLPLPYNTVLNFSSTWGPNAIYLLATSESMTYTMCSMRVALSPNCSTEYHASMSGGSLNTHCDDPNDRLAYGRSQPLAPNGKWYPDWVDVASEWATAISLGDGINDAASSNARLLTQLIPTTPALDPSLPSISEALAVLAGNTILLSAIDSPFIHYWNYSTTVNTLEQPQYQAFNATLKTQAYASGGTQPWQGIFYIVLTLVFITNVCCLLYFGFSGSLVTDFIEPQNLFSLSLNSPPSAVLEGSCGGGPEGEHFQVPWTIGLDKESEHLYIESREGWTPGKSSRPVHKHQRSWSGRTDYEMEGSPVVRMYNKLNKRRTSLL